MTAQRHFNTRREPTDPIIVAVSHDERGFGEVVLGSDRLHECLGGVLVQEHDCGGIPGEAPPGECINLENSCAHRQARKGAHCIADPNNADMDTQRP